MHMQHLLEFEWKVFLDSCALLGMVKKSLALVILVSHAEAGSEGWGNRGYGMTH